MKKSLLALAISIALLTFSSHWAFAQCPDGINAGTVTPPGQSTFCLGVSSASDIAGPVNPSPDETLLPDYTYAIIAPNETVFYISGEDVAEKTGEFIIGLTADGSFDFNGLDPFESEAYETGSYRVIGFAFNQEQLDVIAGNINSDAGLQALLCTITNGAVCPTEEEPLPVPFPLQELLDIAFGVFGPLTVEDVETGISTVAGILGDICYAIDETEGSAALYNLTVTDDPDACFAENNNCSGAVALTLPTSGAGTDPAVSGPFDNSTASHTDSDPEAPECFGENSENYFQEEPLDNTLWFSFEGDGNAYHFYTSRTSADGTDLSDDDYITDGDTQMAIYTGDCGSLELVDCNEDDATVFEYNSNSHWPTGISFQTTAGVTYYMMIDGFNFLGAPSIGQFYVHARQFDCSSSAIPFAAGTADVALCPGDEVTIAIDEANVNLGTTGEETFIDFLLTVENPYDYSETGDPRAVPSESVLGLIGNVRDEGSTISTVVSHEAYAGIIEQGFTTVYLSSVSVQLNSGNSLLFSRCYTHSEPVAIQFRAEDDEECIDCIASYGTVIAPENTTVCEGGSFTFDVEGDAVGTVVDEDPEYVTIFVVTQGEDLTIVDAAGGGEEFSLAPGDYLVHAFNVNIASLDAVDPDGEGFSTGGEVAALIADGSLCADLDVDGVAVSVLGADTPECFVCAADYGAVAAPGNTTVCEGTSLRFSTNGANADGYTTAWVVTTGSELTIVDVSTDGVISRGAGTYTIHAINIVDGDVGTVLDAVASNPGLTGGDVAGLIADGAICADLDVAGTSVTFLASDDAACIGCVVSGGDLSTDDPTTVCSGDGIDDVVNVSVSGVNGSYLFVVTNANGEVLASQEAATFNFEGAPPNEVCYIYGVAYEGNAPGIGATIASITGDCFDLSTNRIEVLRLAPIVISTEIQCAEGADEGGDYDLILSASGGYPEYDNNFTYTFAGVHNGIVRFGEVIPGIVQDGAGFNLEVSDGVCSASVSRSEVICSKCETQAGDISVVDGETDGMLCDGESISITSTGEELGGGCLIYAVHTSSGSSVGTVIASNTTGMFTYADILAGGGMYGVTYYISAVVVGDCTDGNLDIANECTRVSPGVPVVIIEPMEVSAVGNCNDNFGIEQVRIFISGGMPPFTLSGSVNGEFSIASTILIQVPDGDTYQVFIQDAAGCMTSISGEANCKKVPVEWVSWSGEAMPNGNEISWMTATETNSHYFNIERSANGVDFEVIGTVDAAGNSSSANSYSWTDKTPFAGDSYYRIVQYDYDGQNSQTPEFVVTRGEFTFAVGSISPVPVQDVMQVAYTIDTDAVITLTIYDLTGRTVQARTVKANAGINNATFDVSAMSSGVYMLAISNGQEVITERVVVE